ncbi:hypothetical protein ACWC3Y_10780 [Streptomyces sp. NPDC001296]
MPPRKRAQTAPKTDELGETAEPLTEGEPEPSGPDADGATAEPERSDLQAVNEPCPTCFPGGWPEQSFAVGCEHGSWQRA